MSARVTLVGNLTKDPVESQSQRGDAITKFDVAVNRPQREGAEAQPPSYYNVTCFGSLAQNVARSVHKGTRVMVEGNLDVRTIQREDGSKATFVNVVADSVAAELRFATVDVQPGFSSAQQNTGEDRRPTPRPQGGRPVNAPRTSGPARRPEPPRSSREQYVFDEEPF